MMMLHEKTPLHGNGTHFCVRAIVCSGKSRGVFTGGRKNDAEDKTVKSAVKMLQKGWKIFTCKTMWKKLSAQRTVFECRMKSRTASILDFMKKESYFLEENNSLYRIYISFPNKLLTRMEKTWYN